MTGKRILATPGSGGFTFRPGTPDDAAAMAATVREGFESYRAFAPPGWEPPRVEEEAGRMRAQLASGGAWCLLAEASGAPAGHVTLVAARHARRVDLEAGLGHLQQLFVRSEHWGSGLATRLLDAAVVEAADRGWTALRLFTPAGHARARRFYEREGFSLSTPPFHDDDIGFAIVEYRMPPSAAPG
jgi:GNAT superfamily N-acetyltransferase